VVNWIIPLRRFVENLNRRTEMQRWMGFAGLLVLGLSLLTAGAARAERVPSQKTVVPRDPGVRGDITVPYLTDGTSNLITNGYVAPRVYSSPIVDDPRNPGARPVYNLPFWGGVQSFGDKSNGAVPRQTPIVVGPK
jgi:hypothetical protein